jgi:dipeptidyl aminopeptidase/acylaminoacyl peptidase|tara:strand:- start:139 stop:2559 length:2421 start_codon:yes stop_codon:yes gene_type:complete
MNYKKLLFFNLIFFSLYAQEGLEYQVPPKEILDLIDVTMPPRVLVDDNKNYMVYLYRDTYKTIEELSEKEMRLAGLRINPKTNIGSRVSYYNNIKISSLENNPSKIYDVKGMPTDPRISNIEWSPDQTKIAMTNTTKEGLELWILDLKTSKLKRLTAPKLNANLGNVINWFKDSESLLVKFVPAKIQSITLADDLIPAGPRISTNNGEKAQNRTYQDLLKNKNDEKNFEILAMSDLYKVSIKGKKRLWKKSDMHREISFSPDGAYVLVSIIKKPFSYIVPYYRFPSKYIIYKSNSKKIKILADIPLIEDLPKGFMAVRKGARSFKWRLDKPASICFVSALDNGDPKEEVQFRDELFQLDAPFNKNPVSMLKTQNRYYQSSWCNDTLAIVSDYWWNNRNKKTYLFNPSDLSKEPLVISDRNYQDRYNDPGDFEKERNIYGEYVLVLRDKNLYLIGDGFSSNGQFPFLDEFKISTLKKKRIYQSSAPGKKESLRSFNPDDNKLFVRIESPNEYPNYYFRNLDGELSQVTYFVNPFKSIQNVYKELIKYKREDGLDLSATLYLPEGYDFSQKEKLPMVMWAYPREYKDKSSASQTTKNPNQFTYPYAGSPIYWLTRGYAVLDDVAFPIVGEGDEQPNDDFRNQLVNNAKAAIEKVDSLGYVDINRIAVGGHSYGAFMVANLLSHSNYFAAGIARSGAYNRTLTPFGFQSEERNYWEAPQVYYNMSPFMHADKLKSPILLIHGDADNNSGTYPLQSERYFNALKGLGATARLVMLPKESHGYRAKESILHMLWEQDTWLEKFVKNKKVIN